MYLCDQIAQSKEEIRIEAGDGRRWLLPGAVHLAAPLKECPNRYILGEGVTHACRQLVLRQPHLLDPRSQLLRVPHRQMWIEWREGDAQGEARRTGVYIEADETGRRGSLQSLWEAPPHQPDLAQGYYGFDFDAPLSRGFELQAGPGFETSPEIHERLDQLVRHAALHVSPPWLACWRAAARDGAHLAETLHFLFRQTWTDFPFACAFLLLLNAKRALSTRPIALAALNRRRLSRNVPPLLDHVEVKLDLGQATGDGRVRGGRSRLAPRLHQVRGHLVARGDNIFWRATHLRGDAARGLVTRRTVLVRRSNRSPSAEELVRC
ncbi:MAG TPA: hypothetical protein VF574_12010 [Allosphingosinicella sp.]|jgi:hypothetical protein